MLFLKLVVMLVLRHLALKKTLEQSYTSLHLHLHEPIPSSYSCPSPASKASWERKSPLISWLLDGFIKAGKFGSIHEQPGPDLVLTSPLRERGGASRNFRPVDTRDRSPLLLLIIILLLLSASPIAWDKRGSTWTGQTETLLHVRITEGGRFLLLVSCSRFTLLRSRSDASERDRE